MERKYLRIFKPLCLTTEVDAAVVAATLNSSLFYWWFIVRSNCRDLTLREVSSFPIGVDQMDEEIKPERFLNFLLT